MAIRVFVVDDSDVFVDAVRELLAVCSEFELVGATHTGEAALRSAPDTHPDVVLIDVTLPGMDGPSTWRALTRMGVDARYILCSVGDDPRKPRDGDDVPAAFVAKAEISARTLREAWATRPRSVTAEADTR
jgi:DNA-binding NarL/FixJ family response regulator